MSTQSLSLKSLNQWVADGSQTVWNFSFSGGYINTGTVRAQMTDPSGTITPIVLTAANFVGPFQLSIVPAVPSGYKLTIYRDSSNLGNPLVVFSDTTLFTKSNLDIAATQGLFVAVETKDSYSIITPGDLTTLGAAALASATAAGVSAGAAAASATAASGSATASATSAAAVYSTAQFASLTLAVADAYSTGKELKIVSGTYNVAGNIPNLHDIDYNGNAKIVRGPDTFYLRPTVNQTNRIYVDVNAGSDTNDGLTAALAVATVSRAFDILSSYGPVLRGTWRIVLAAGTYPGGYTFPENLRGFNRVYIEGPAVGHPNTPTAVFDGQNVRAFGLNKNGHNKLYVQNIKCINMLMYGMVSQDICDITYYNVHCDLMPNAEGIKMQQGRLRITGGKLNNCLHGVSAISSVTFTIGGTSLVDGTQITNCIQGGILAQEQSSGHADFVTITNCAVGLEATVHSRFHAQGCVITLNVTAAVRTTDSSWYDNGTSAGFSGNGVNYLCLGSGGEISRDGTFTIGHKQPVDLAFVTNTGVITVQTLKTYATAILPNGFTNSTKGLEILIYGELTGVAGTKNITVNINGSPWFGFTIPAAATGSYVIRAHLFAQNGAAQSYAATCHASVAISPATGSRSITMNSGASLPITVTGQNGSAADSLTVRGIQVITSGGC